MSAGKFRLHSKDFRRGIIEGFGAPMFFFIPRSYLHSPPTTDYDEVLRRAWEDVSRALEESMQAEREGGKARHGCRWAR